MSGGIFAAAWAALAIFGLLHAGAMLAERTFPRWLLWVSARPFDDRLEGAVPSGETVDVDDEIEDGLPGRRR